MISSIIKCGMKLLLQSQTSTLQPLKFGVDKEGHAILYNGGSYLFMLGLKLTHVSIMGSRWMPQLLSSNCMVKRLTLIYMDNLSEFLCGVYKIMRPELISFNLSGNEV